MEYYTYAVYRYDVAGGQHYFMGLKSAISVKDSLKEHILLKSMKGEVYAMGWIQQLHTQIAKGEDAAIAAKCLPEDKKLDEAELIELQDLTVPVAIATLVREHNDVADLHKSLSNEQILRYMRDIWQRNQEGHESHWKKLADIPAEQIRAICVFTGLHMSTVMKKLAIASATPKCWGLVEEVWSKHKKLELRGQSTGNKTKSKKQPAGPKKPFNTKYFEEIFSLPLPSHIPFALEALACGEWKPTDVSHRSALCCVPFPSWRSTFRITLPGTSIRSSSEKVPHVHGTGWPRLFPLSPTTRS